MRAVDIRIKHIAGGLPFLKATVARNWRYYFQEGLGLAIFMASACLFSGLLFGKNGYCVATFPAIWRQLLLGILMGLTALFIFYSPYTSPSGSQINPAVTIAFLKLKKISFCDAFFYIVFQFAGGVAMVYGMAFIMGSNLTSAPLHDVVTIPGKWGTAAAAWTELFIAFMMMSMILFTSDHPRLKKYTRIFAAVLVCIYVVFAGPVSGFGMNPARSFASALPADIWTDFWIYLWMPVAGMLAATEVYLFIRKIRSV